jgi:hypothetical protein
MDGMQPLVPERYLGLEKAWQSLLQWVEAEVVAILWAP